MLTPRMPWPRQPDATDANGILVIVPSATLLRFGATVGIAAFLVRLRDISVGL